MTKFGKFKLRFIGTINLAAMLSIFNIASTTSSYWVKYIDNNTGGTHYAGMWRSCPNQGECVWKNGIVNHMHSTWSIFVRVLITLGTVFNVIVVGIFTAALIFKITKKSRFIINCLEAGNLTLVGSFISLLIGFCIFISSSCNISLWLHVFSMICLIITCNLLTRNFAALYFQTSRNRLIKSVNTAISHSKLPNESEEEAVALTKNEEQNDTKKSIEMNKIENGSNEALTQTPAQVEILITPTETKQSEQQPTETSQQATV